ncbi:MAG: tRNA lysidine(34) synthetase TilS [Methylobacter sp.]|nr:tRNA lysidine(34) synthetase TilS [Methylobacter sp.]
MLLSSQTIESALIPFNFVEHCFIAYSGGVDSHVLLHLCVSIKQLKGKITAVYVHHGLQAEADSWADHCEKTAEDLGVDFLMRRVKAMASPGESREEAARNARYTALKSLLGINDVLMVAQHREDQLETVLLQLFRGSGLRGLCGMPEIMPFGQGHMLRPLLAISKQALNDYARAHALRWVEDPSNQCNDYDRNFLRNKVVPLLKQRWPSIEKTVARSARHCAEAQILISALTDELFEQAFNKYDRTLCISKLQEHTYAQQQLVIRHWFHSLGLKMPAQAFIKSLLTQVLAARKDSDPVLSGQGYCVRRYQDKLYCLQQSITEARQDISWPAGQPSLKIADREILSCVPSSAGLLREQWDNSTIIVRFRRGGEKICLPGRKGHHSLKNLFQEAGIPPWERKNFPLVYLNNELAAVGDKWISATFYSEKTNACISLARQRLE